LEISSTLKGDVVLTDRAFAIAVACEAADKPVWMTFKIFKEGGTFVDVHLAVREDSVSTADD
jgi:hypothetical protein